jgi:competence protein ComEC
MKRPLGAALLLFLIGTVYAVYGVTLSLIAGIILLLIFSGFTIKSRIRSWRKMIDIFMLFLFFSIGIIRGNIYTSEVAHRTSAYADGHKVTLTCIVDNIENKTDSLRITGKSSYILKNGIKSDKIGKIYIYPKKKNKTDTRFNNEIRSIDSDNYINNQSDNKINNMYIYPGDRIIVTGEVSAFSPASNEGGYDENRQLLSQGIFLKIYDSKIQEEKRPFFSITRFLYKLRCRLRSVYINSLPGEEGDVLSGMTIGDKGNIPDELMDIFKFAGICHLLSVSGTHIDVVSRGLYKRLKKRKFGAVKSGIIALITALLYGRLCGNSVSTIRSVGMFSFSVLAMVTGASYDGITALMAVGSIMLLVNPILIDYSGFVFSFGTVIGVMLFAAPVHLKYTEYKRKKWDDAKKMGLHDENIYHPTALDIIMGQLIFSIAIQIFTIPIISFYYYEIPVYGAFLNLFLLPLFPYLLVSGLAGGVLGVVGIRFLANIFLYFCHVIIYIFEAASDLSINLPASTLIVGKPSIIWIIIYYVILFVIYMSITRNKKKIFIPVIGGALLLTMIVYPRSTQKEIDMLDVGQGDGIYFSTGDRTNVFIDGGSSSIDKVGKYNILPFLKSRGVRKIDMWFVTHSDTDHISGLVEALESGYPIGKIVTSKQMMEADSFEQVKKAAEHRQVEIVGVNADDIITFPEEDTEVEILSPVNGDREEDINKLSLVFSIKSGGFNALFTGDIDKETEKKIIDRKGAGELSDITILKAAHHGSRFSNSKEFLEAVSPKITMISAGRKNRYGHPGNETLERLKEAGSKIYCTKWQYQIKVLLNKDGSFLVEKPNI